MPHTPDPQITSTNQVDSITPATPIALDTPTFTATLTASSCRLDKFLAANLPSELGIVSRETIKKAIKSGNCQVNQLPCSDSAYKLKSGDLVSLSLPQVTNELIPEQGQLKIIYSDQDLIVINKSPGLTVHPAPSCPQGTLVHQLIAGYPQLLHMEGQRPGIVHRLDKDTSGLLCIALNESTRLSLSTAFAQREVHKEYLALVWGKAAATGEVNQPLGRDPKNKLKMAIIASGKPAFTQWTTLYTSDNETYSLLRVKIHTGRTHQIRVHLAAAGLPIIGDSTYGNSQQDQTLLPTLPQLRQLLHAYKLSFTHPTTQTPLTFNCPPPQDFLHTATLLNQQLQRVIVTGIAGCGKSSFVQFIADHNIPTWSADAAVAKLYAYGGAAWEYLHHAYGLRFMDDPKSPVNRQKLSQAITTPGSGLTLEDLEALLHPMLKLELQNFWQTNSNQTLAIAEVPLWFELGWYKQQNLTIAVVQCNLSDRDNRLKTIRNWSEEFKAKIDSKQWSQEKKIAHAQIIIPNLQDLSQLQAQALLLLSTLQAQRDKNIAAFTQQWQILITQP